MASYSTVHYASATALVFFAVGEEGEVREKNIKGRKQKYGIVHECVRAPALDRYLLRGLEGVLLANQEILAFIPIARMGCCRLKAVVRLTCPCPMPTVLSSQASYQLDQT